MCMELNEHDLPSSNAFVMLVHCDVKAKAMIVL